MAEAKYESKITSIPAPAAQVYAVLGNLKNLERVEHLIPRDKVQEMEIDRDFVRMKVDGLGQKFTIGIVERTENECLKFGTENLPLQANFWIQLKEVNPTDTRLKLTLKADLPIMFKMMLEAKIQKGLDDAADMLTQFPYSQWQNA